MRVSALYDTALVRDRDVFIVGLGPSMSVFPIRVLEDKFCILLNDAQKVFPTLGPVAFANHRQFLENPSEKITLQIVKGRLKSDPEPERDDNHVSWSDPDRYVFSYRCAPYDPVHTHDEILLFAPGEEDYYWSGPVAVYACQFACLAGARSITLVGCDCAPLASLDYCDERVEVWRRELAKSFRVKRSKAPVRHNYEDYASGLLVVKREAERRFGVSILSLTPFMGVVDPHAQLKLMRCGWNTAEPRSRRQRGPHGKNKALSQRRIPTRRAR